MMKRPITFIILLLFAAGCDSPGNKEKVFVSVLPLKYFTEQIAGNTIEVEVMVPPGMSPATYEPLPSQMLELNKAKLLVTSGVPFEQVWLDKITSFNNGMLIVPSYAGIELHAGHEHADGEEHLDPHIWTDPILCKSISENIARGLSGVFPERQQFFEDNLAKLLSELDSLDSGIISIFANSNANSFMIYHPALGYFAERYGLEQISLEHDGKEPSPQRLKRLVAIAREHGIKQIFVQEQFPKTIAESIARELNLKITVIDPLSNDYKNNMLRIANLIAGEQG